MRRKECFIWVVADCTSGRLFVSRDFDIVSLCEQGSWESAKSVKDTCSQVVASQSGIACAGIGRDGG